MIIYVVKQGDSLYSISQKYGVSVEKLIADNVLLQPENLVVGQTIVVLLEEKTHTVQRGDTLYALAQKYGVPLSDIISANPSIVAPYVIYPGQSVIIPVPSQKIGTFEVNGFTFPNINSEVFDKTINNLTYLSIFSYEVNADGTLNPIIDEPLIQKSRAAGVAPMMVITNIDADGGFSGEITNSILTNQQVQTRLIANIIETLKTKNYYGLVVDFEYIFPSDRDNYTAFLQKLTTALHALGYKVFVSVAPKTRADQPGVLYEAHDYNAIGKIADRVIIMTYEWGYTYGPPLAVAPINLVENVLKYAVTAIPPEKILMGIPNYGYDWALPYVQGTAATVIGNVQAVEKARLKGSFIHFDTLAQAPFFNYYESARQHIVWFEDARSIEAKLLLASQYKLAGVSYWTIGRYFPQNWLVQNVLYTVKKLL